MSGQDFELAQRLGEIAGRTTRLFRRYGAILVAGVAAIILNGNAVAAVGDPGIVSYVNNYIGISGELVSLPGAGIEINHNPVSGQSEALALNLGAEYTEVTVTVGALLETESGGYREWGAWEAFDGTGRPVGEDTFYGPQTTVTIDAPGMQYLVFTARPYTLRTSNDGDTASAPAPGPGPSGSPPNDSSDYYLTALSVTGGPSLPSPDATGAVAWEGVSPAGFESTTPYLDGGRFVDAPLVVNTLECAGNLSQNNTKGCELQLTGAFKTSIKNSPDVNGAIGVNNILTIVDTRPDCGGVGGIDGPLDLAPSLVPGASGGPFVPAHLCGIPNEEGIPEFTLLDINNISLTTEYSVLEHEIDDKVTAGYECDTGADILSRTDGTLPQRRSKLPVVAWLPKGDGTEIPVKGAGGTPVTQLQDITYGCGSTRGGTARYSYFVYNLHHIETANYVGIVREALNQLKVTIDQTSVCIDPGNGGYSGLASSIKSIIDAYDTGRYSLAKSQLQRMLDKVESNKQLNAQFRQCFYALTQGDVIFGSSGQYVGDTSIVPRNFRADLIVQSRHALYMFGRMLGIIDRRLPDDFKGLPPI